MSASWPTHDHAIRLSVAWFENQSVKGELALGNPETLSWGDFISIFEWRREVEKDGPCFIPARFTLEPDGQVHRVTRKLLARTAIALDVETSKTTGEVPPSLDQVMARAKALALAALGYTSHNHHPSNIRYRMVLPLSEEIPHELPAPEIMAGELYLQGVLDLSKLGAASLFFLPSCPYDNQTIVIPGAPVEADWMIEHAGTLLAARQAEADHIAAAAHAEAAARLQAKIAAGIDPDNSLIERLRPRFNLDSVLRSHGYDKAGTKYRHPNSESGSFGADIKTLGGIERVYSHNAGNPLHHSNLPAWCTVTAIDAFDATVILDFGGDRTRALRELAERFNLTKAAEQKTVAALLFRLIRQGASQQKSKRRLTPKENAKACQKLRLFVSRCGLPRQLSRRRRPLAIHPHYRIKRELCTPARELNMVKIGKHAPRKRHQSLPSQATIWPLQPHSRCGQPARGSMMRSCR